MWSDNLKQEVAHKIWKYREEYNIEGNDKEDYYSAEHFLNTWYTEYQQAGSDYLWAWCVVRFR